MPPPLPVRCAHGASSSSAAGLFVRLLCASSSRSANNSSSSSSAPILDVLLPPRARAFHLAARDFQGRTRNTRTRGFGSTASVAHSAALRPFSATVPWRKTMVVYNPQKDEDGNDMMLEITPRAANKLSQIMAKDKNPNLALRISVESGGCHGFQYLMSLTSLPPSFPSASSAAHTPPETSSHPPSPAGADAATTAAEVAPSTTTSASRAEPSVGEDDTIFAFVSDSPGASPAGSETDTTADAAAPGTPKVILDTPSLELLKGSKVDYTMELIGSQFKIVDNPLATSSCGCGTSFDIKL